MFSGRLVTIAAVAVLALGLPAVALAIRLEASSTVNTARSIRMPTSSTTRGVPEVGALFANASSTQHGCTASVVDSLQGDVLLTAAHCVSGNGAGMVFAPGYHDGISPYGRWTVTALHLAPGWLKSQDPQDDFAFLTVAPRTIDGRRIEIQQVTGAYQLGGNPHPARRSQCWDIQLGATTMRSPAGRRCTSRARSHRSTAAALWTARVVGHG
jgi:V8-like Glu-specific endopeptidase